MPQSFAAVYIYWVFSAKHRKPFLKEKKLRTALHSVLGGIAKKLGCIPLRVGGVEDHVHMLTTFGSEITIANTVKEIKRASNHWIAENNPIPGFSWQAGYAAFSVSKSQVPRISEYIDNQEEHHRRISFKDEMRELFRKHVIEFDERYVWD